MYYFQCQYCWIKDDLLWRRWEKPQQRRLCDGHVAAGRKIPRRAAAATEYVSINIIRASEEFFAV
jgi:hypothetical protein